MAERVGRHRFGPGDPLSRARPGTLPSALGPGGRAPVLHPGTELLEQVDDPDPVLALDLAIGLGTAQRQTGDPAFRDTLLEAAQRAAEFGDTERLVAAALANNRGFYSAIGAPTARRSKCSKLPSTTCQHAIRNVRSSWRHCALNSPTPVRWNFERPWRRKPRASPTKWRRRHLRTRAQPPLHPAPGAAAPGSGADPNADALIRAERLGDPALLYWAAMWRYQTAARSGDIEEVDRCLEIQGAMAEQLGQPLFAWGHTFLQAQRAFIAGDTDRAEALASEALQIGTDSGQPDAALIYGTQLIGSARPARHHERADPAHRAAGI